MKDLNTMVIRGTVVFFFSLVAISVQGQMQKPLSFPVLSKIQVNPLPQISSDALLNELRKKASFKTREASINRQILQATHTLGTTATYLLPVVYHLIGIDPSTITDAQVMLSLQNLNQAFSKTGPYAASLGADTKIQFCLAQKDPDGGNTTGITRTVSTLGNNLNAFIADDKLKNLNRWDPSRYINIWIISSLNTENMPTFNCGVWTRLGEGGYAYFPGAAPSTDGIVLAGISPGPGLAHEMGHYLSLYHTFEGRNCANNDCTTDGDHVCDTPPDNNLNDAPSCTSPGNSCTTDTSSNFSDGNFPVDVPDLIADFMDYGNYACHNEFTEGQAERMQAAIVTQRSGLLQNECDKPCTESAVANFTRDKSSPIPGDIINFTNNSTGAANYSWLVDGVVAGTGANFSKSFAAAGTYKVTLKAYNANPNCFAAYTDYIIVTCGVLANFYSDKRTIATASPSYLDSIFFTNTSQYANTYTWLLANNGGPEQVVGTSKDLNYVFLNPGDYTMRLVATNGGCSDTTEFYTIPVADATPDAYLILNEVECYDGNKIRVAVQVHNNGYAPIPANMPITFYNGDPRNGANKIGTTFFTPDPIQGSCWSNSYPFIVDVNSPGLNQLYAVFNDSGRSNPFKLPGTNVNESNYFNNFAFANNFQFSLNAFPATASLLPGDTLQLVTTTLNGSGNGITTSFVWSSDEDLNCVNCANPYFIAERRIYEITKKVVGTTSYGCVDSAFVDIKIPPYDDFVVAIDSVECAGTNDSHINFTICNNFTRGFVPKGLNVSFYDSDPAGGNALLRGPVFIVPVDSLNNCASFSTTINGQSPGTVYAVVNANGTLSPPVFPADTLYIEKDYTNNQNSFVYLPEIVMLQPEDSTIFRKQTIQANISSAIFDPLTTNWIEGDGYNLSCTNCNSPVITVFDSSVINMVTANQYGCLIKGKLSVNVFPPDMTVQILGTTCYSNSQTLVKFMICMNNGYDSIFTGLPVSFYDGQPNSNHSNVLSPVFYTGNAIPNACDSFSFIVRSPLNTNNLYASVNDKGDGYLPDKLFNETDYTNNLTNAQITPFLAMVNPSDTTVARFSQLQLTGSANGGQMSYYNWESTQALSCINCLTTMVSPPYSSQYLFIVKNENQCLDTAYADIKTFAGGSVDIPNAFSPNGDGRNDIFYILGNRDIKNVKEFSIFNRQGMMIFNESNVPPNDPNYGWNGMQGGRPVPAETYVYMILIEFSNGTEQLFKGTVIVVH
jgi:gliding motility-associated-like protein